MKAEARKAIAVGWLAIVIPFGGVAAFQLYCLMAGIYDPVQHDQMQPDSVAGLRAWLIAIVIAIFTSLPVGWYVYRTSQRV